MVPYRIPLAAAPVTAPLRAVPARPLPVVALLPLVPLLLAGCAAGDVPASEPTPVTAAAGTLAAWAWHMPQCVGYDEGAYRAPSHRVAAASHGTTVREVYEPGWAERAMAEIRQVVAACGSYESGGSGDPSAFREQTTVVDDGFAGDDSLLVRTTRLTPPQPVQEWYVAVVRRGDEVVTVRADSQDAAVRAAAHPEAGG